MKSKTERIFHSLVNFRYLLLVFAYFSSAVMLCFVIRTIANIIGVSNLRPKKETIFLFVQFVSKQFARVYSCFELYTSTFPLFLFIYVMEDGGSH